MLAKLLASPYSRLMRLDKPIGIYLLLWPTLWALWVASNGTPYWQYLIIFSLGTVVMRSAGCVINDYADRHFDGMVNRTQNRPLATGEVTEQQTLALFLLLIAIAFGLVLFLDWHTVALSFVGLLLASCYPFMKRYTHFPQVVLGAAFSWSMPMAFMAVQADLPNELWLLYFANLCWTVAYDTYYAMVDRDDDLKIGVKSTAIAFGRYDLSAIIMLQGVTLLLLLATTRYINWQWPFYLSIIIAAGLFIKQWYAARNREPATCFKAFLDNHYVGMVIFFGIAGHFAL